MPPLHIHSYYLCRYSKNCGSFLNADSSQLDTHHYLVVMFNDNKKKYGFIHSAKEITFTNSSQMWRDFINCDKIWHHPFKKRWKWYVLWIFQEETCHFAERYTWIMRTRISSCCHILSAVSVCECVTLCRRVSPLRWLVCFSSQVLVCQDVEGEQHASGRLGSKGKGPSVILMQHCWAQVPW